MSPPEVVVDAVLQTLVRATADQRTLVVLRSSRSEQAVALAQWLSCAHGSQRRVIASMHGAAEIEVRLPARMIWPVLGPRSGAETLAGLAVRGPTLHLSGMIHDTHDTGTD